QGRGDWLGRHVDALRAREASQLRIHVAEVDLDAEGAGRAGDLVRRDAREHEGDRKSTRLNSSHGSISYAVFCLKKKNKTVSRRQRALTPAASREAHRRTRRAT